MNLLITLLQTKLILLNFKILSWNLSNSLFSQNDFEVSRDIPFNSFFAGINGILFADKNTVVLPIYR